uniref:Uncharacterized protein n=1 Tax=Anguilla anguilla TaxID=7936 RepID=A0A0E9V5P1_ANGAN
MLRKTWKSSWKDCVACSRLTSLPRRRKWQKFCSILIQITEITGPINEQLKDYEHLSALFVDENRAELIERVGTPMSIADSYS